jgi:hypothetical protein
MTVLGRVMGQHSRGLAGQASGSAEFACQSMVREMDPCRAYVKIQVIRSQSVKCLLKAFLRIGMMGIPQLAGDEDLFTRHIAVLDALSDLVFVPVDSWLR